MQLFELLKWLSIFEESMLVLISMFMIARYVFLDVIINNTYHLDDIFDFPAVTDKIFSAIFDKDFDEYEESDNVCDRMCCLYNIIKHLLQIATEKVLYRNYLIHPVIEFIKANFVQKHIDAAQVIGGDIHLLTIKAVAHRILAQNLR